MDKRVLWVFFLFILISGLIWLYTFMMKIETEEISFRAPKIQKPASSPVKDAPSFSLPRAGQAVTMNAGEDEEEDEDEDEFVEDDWSSGPMLN